MNICGRCSLCCSGIVASHLRIFFDILHLSLTRLLIPDQTHFTPRNARTKSPGASAGRIGQPRPYDPTLTRYSPTIPTLPLDIHTPSYAPYPLSTAQQSSWARIAHTLGGPRLVNTPTTISHPRSAITPRYVIASSTTSNFDDRSPTPK